MARWVILKTDSGSEYINLDAANRIILNERNHEYVIEFNNGRITIKQDVNPATFAHISTYLGDMEIPG